jgi:hypothetical protein
MSTPEELQIIPRFTFLGFIPKDSNKEHLGIILVTDDTFIKYCYCTSQEKIFKYYSDYFILEEGIMREFFPNNPRRSFIVLTPDTIGSIPSFVFINYLKTGEFEPKGFLDETVFKELITKILTIDSFPERFKQELIGLLDSYK